MRAASMVLGTDVPIAPRTVFLTVHFLLRSAHVRAIHGPFAVLHVPTTVGETRATSMVARSNVPPATRTSLLTVHLLLVDAHPVTSTAAAARLVGGLAGGVLVVLLPRGATPPRSKVLLAVVTVLVFPIGR